MNLIKSIEFFNPDMVEGRIHIIGCGSVGSVIAENLARFGLTKFTLYDFDTVEAKNIVNQMFSMEDVGMLKVEAVSKMIMKINPEAAGQIRCYSEGWHGQKLSGYIFLCVDNIDLRREIVTANMANPNIKAMFDFRTSLMDAQHYAADWKNVKMRDNFLATMDFSHEEAKEATPVSACGVTLGVAPTVRMICTMGVCNFINFVKEKQIKKFILTNPFNFTIDAV